MGTATAQQSNAWRDALVRNAQNGITKHYAWNRPTSKGVDLTSGVKKATKKPLREIMPLKNPAVGPRIPSVGAPSVQTSDPQLAGMSANGMRAMTQTEVDAQMATIQRQWTRAVNAIQMGRDGSVPQAKRLLEALVSEDITNEKAVNGLADIYLNEGDYVQTLALLGSASDHNASDETLLKLALAGAMTGHVYPGQRSYCEKYVSNWKTIDPNSVASTTIKDSTLAAKVSALFALACWHTGRGDAKAATPFFVRALRLDPGNGWGHEMLGKFYAASRTWPDAEREFALAVRHSSGLLKILAKNDLDSATYSDQAEGRKPRLNKGR